MPISEKLFFPDREAHKIVAARRFAFPCSVVKVIDGDTLDAMIDRGLCDYTLKRIRLFNVVAIESRGKLAQAAKCKQIVESWIANRLEDIHDPAARALNVPDHAYPFIVEFTKVPNKVTGTAVAGRFEAVIWSWDGRCLNFHLAQQYEALGLAGGY